MTAGPPLTAAGSRQPEKAPPIPTKVRDAIRLMVFGKPDDENCAPLDFIEAGRMAGIKPDVMRRYLDRPTVRSLLLAERRAFRNAINAGNELSLKNIRDTAANSMARIGAIRTLEELGTEDAERHGRAGQREVPGVTIIVEAATAPPSTTIDIIPVPQPTLPEPPARDTEPPASRPDPMGLLRRRW
jgi:hypothetical protein